MMCFGNQLYSFVFRQVGDVLNILGTSRSDIPSAMEQRTSQTQIDDSAMACFAFAPDYILGVSLLKSSSLLLFVIQFVSDTSLPRPHST